MLLPNSRIPAPATRRMPCWLLIGVLLLAGCSIAPQPPAIQPVCAVEVSSPPAGMAALEYQNTAGLRCSQQVPAGRYEVQVSVQWSNGWVDTLVLSDDLALRSGERYSIRAAEAGGGEAVALGARLYPPVTLGQKAVLYALAAPFIVGPLLLYLPASMLLEDEGPQRPTEDCCHVWLLREPDGEIVADVAP